MSVGHGYFGHGSLYQFDDFVVADALYTVGQLNEPCIYYVQFFFGEFVAQILAALLQCVAAAVLSQNQFTFGNANGLWIYDLISGFIFQVTILMDTRFMGECVVADDGFIGLWAEGDDRCQ